MRSTPLIVVSPIGTLPSSLPTEQLVRRTNPEVSAGIEAGSVRYGAFVNADGKMVDEGNVYKFSDDRYWVLINSPDLEDWFRETAGDLNATIAHKTQDLAMIAVQGPTSQATLQPLTERDLGELRYFHFWPHMTTVAGVPAYIFRTGFSGEHGYEVVTEPSNAQVVWDALISAGATPFGLNAIDLARTEVGLVIIAVDTSSSHRWVSSGPGRSRSAMVAATTGEANSGSTSSPASTIRSV